MIARRMRSWSGVGRAAGAFCSLFAVVLLGACGADGSAGPQWSAAVASEAHQSEVERVGVQVVPGGLGNLPDEPDVLVTAFGSGGAVRWSRQFGTDGPDVPLSVERQARGVVVTYLSVAGPVRVTLDADGAVLDDVVR